MAGHFPRAILVYWAKGGADVNGQKGLLCLFLMTTGVRQQARWYDITQGSRRSI